MTSSNNSQEIEKQDQNIVLNDESKTFAEKILEFVKYPLSTLLFCFIFYGFLNKNGLLDKQSSSWNYMDFISIAAAIAVALAVSFHSKERDKNNRLLYIPIALITSTLIFTAVIYQFNSHQSNIISISLGVTLFLYFTIDILGGDFKLRSQMDFDESKEKDSIRPEISRIITIPLVILASCTYLLYLYLKFENNNAYLILFSFFVPLFIFTQGFILRLFLRMHSVKNQSTKFRTVGNGLPDLDSILVSISTFVFLAYLPIIIFETHRNIIADAIFAIASIIFSLLIFLGFYRIPPFGYLGSVIADSKVKPPNNSEGKSNSSSGELGSTGTCPHDHDDTQNSSIPAEKKTNSGTHSKSTQSDSLEAKTETDEYDPIIDNTPPEDSPRTNENAATVESSSAEPTTATDASIQADENTSEEVPNDTGTEAKPENLEEYLNQLKNYLYNYNFDTEKINYIKDILMEANVKPVQQKGEPTYFTLNSIHGRIGVLRIAPYRKNITLKIGANVRDDNEIIENYFILKPKDGNQYNFYHNFVEYNKNYIDNSGLQREPFLLYSPGKKGKKDFFNEGNKDSKDSKDNKDNLINFIKIVDKVKWGNQTETE